MTIRQKSGADILVELLISHHVDTIFCITGAGNLAIIDSVVKDGRIKLVFSHHEQAAVMEAQGYARVSGKLGGALVTTGGGTSNVVTGVLSAHLDSVPVLLISGNESSFHCSNGKNLRAYGVQGFDSVAVLKPVTKLSTRINNVNEIDLVFKEAVVACLQGRMGPAHIDFPMDLQRKILIDPKIETDNIETLKSHSSDKEVEIFASDYLKELSNSKTPVAYFGNGCRNPQILIKVLRFIEKFKIPYFVSWSAIDLFPESDPLNIGRVGIYGDRAANILLQKADSIVTLGTRLAIPQLGYDREDFARKATKWVVDIDNDEIDKFAGLCWNVLCSDIEPLLDQLLASNFEWTVESNAREAWLAETNLVWKQLPRLEQVGPIGEENSNFIHSAEIIAALNSKLSPTALITTDVGAGLLTGHYVYEQSSKRRMFTSQGLGEMGFGLPAAIGAHFAEPSVQIVCLNTDGAIMFNLQELQLVREHKIPLKLFIFNNSGYAMIKISQQNLFESRMAGSTTESGVSFPEFSKVAALFEMDYFEVKTPADLGESFDSALQSKNAVLFEVVMNSEQKYLPRLATSKLADGSLVSPPLEDLDPLIPLDQLETLLGYRPSENSFRARGM